jgi:hypothetical protein
MDVLALAVEAEGKVGFCPAFFIPGNAGRKA